MRHGLQFLIAVTALVSLMMVPLGPADAESGINSIGDQASDHSTITVYGYISNISDREMNIPLAGVMVTLLDSDMQPLTGGKYKVQTGEDGRFEFTFVKEKGEYISFEFEGYKVRTLPRALELVENTDITKIMFDRAIVDENGAYALTGTSDSTSAVGMAVTYGLLYGNVIGVDGEKKTSLENAHVIAVSVDTERTYTTLSDAQGIYELEVPYGTYMVHATCNGFYDSEPIRIETSGGSATDIELEMKEFGFGFIGGLDVAHSMLIIGLVLVVVTLLLVMLLIRNSKQPDSKITLINDLSKYDEADDDLTP